MSDHDADQDEMRRFSNLSDREIDELFAGNAPSADGNYEELATLLSLARSDFSATPDETTEARHVTAIVEAAQLAANGSPASNAADCASEREQWVAFSWRRRMVFNKKISSLAAALGLAGGVVIVGFSGSAYAGVLPDPVQGAVADAGGTIGLSIPGTDENNVDDGHQNNVDDGRQNNVDDGQQGNVDGGQQGNVDGGAPGRVDGGAPASIDDGHQNNVDDGAPSNVDDGDQSNVDDGQQGNVDDGQQGNVDDGPQNNVDAGQQNSSDDGGS